MPRLDDRAFDSLLAYLSKVPSVEVLGFGSEEDGAWWLKLTIDIDHHLAWNVVQELGHVLNHVSMNERLPTLFKPVSPPPYMNGGPRDYLAWVIECTSPEFRPGTCEKWLEGRLPRPVEDLEQWQSDDD